MAGLLAVTWAHVMTVDVKTTLSSTTGQELRSLTLPKVGPASAWPSPTLNVGPAMVLVVQCLRICLPMQGTWIRSLVGELKCHRAAKPQLERDHAPQQRTAKTNKTNHGGESKTVLKPLYFESCLITDPIQTSILRSPHHCLMPLAWTHILSDPEVQR